MQDILARAANARLQRSPGYRAIKYASLERVALACSGGTDSSATLLLMAFARARRQCGPFVVIHIDHQTRPETSSEGKFVAGLCRNLEVPLVRAVVDTDRVTSPGDSIEDALRRARYDALASIALRLGLISIVTGHTRNDQVETVLMRVLSGSGSTAAAGMRHRQRLNTEHGAVEVLRPLLDVPRSDLRAVLATLGITACEDPSNLDIRFRRNAIRRHIIPKMRETVPGFEQALLRSVELSARDADFVDAWATDMYPSLVTKGNGSVVIARQQLNQAHPALANRIIRRAVMSLMTDDGRELSYERIESVRRAALGRTGALIELPYGITASIERTVIALQRKADHCHDDQS